MKEKQITVNDTTVTLRKLPLKRYSEVFAALQSLPTAYNVVTKKHDGNLLNALPELVTTCYDDVVNIIVIITELSKEQVEQFGLADLVAVVEAFLEVNDYSKIYESIKKIQAQPTKQ